MSTVYISEFASLTLDQRAGAGVLIPQWPPVAKQAVAIGSASQPFNAQTRFIRVAVDAVCSINISPGGAAATTADARFSANNTPEILGVQPGYVLTSITNT